jgi:meiotic recombination protein SPO11
MSSNNLGILILDPEQTAHGEEYSNDIQSLLKLSARDRRIARKMLEKEHIFGEDGMEQEWRREVQVMLMLNIKAEIQILGNGQALERWLDGKLCDAVGVK